MESSIDGGASPEPFPELFVLLLADLFTSPLWFYAGIGLLLVILLFCSAMISGSEVAFFSLSPREVSECQDSQEPSARRIANLLDQPKILLATILILNNLVNVAIVTLSTYATWQYFGKEADGEVIAALPASVTIAILFFGEILPKQYAVHYSLLFAKRTAGALNTAARFCKPFSIALMSFSNVVEKQLSKKGYQVSIDELNQALEITTRNDKEATEEEKGILKGIVNFGTLSVKQVMRSRIDITAIDIEIDFHELMDIINKTGYSRLPIYRETVDSIEGILYVKDLLPYLDQEDTFAWQNLLHKGFFVPESKKIDALLKDFQEKRVHMAIVVDEYGGTSGLITLEDIIEEIVGEINDEFDENDIHYNKLDENTFIFEGKTSLNDFCKVLDEDISLFDSVKGESESLGGLLLEIHANLPRAGEKIQYDKYVFTVVAVDNKRIKRIRVLRQYTSTSSQPQENINTSVNR
ncbi:MAG: gliding motility-associated protein GldE [Cyclobacteriaceae bacterium]